MKTVDENALTRVMGSGRRMNSVANGSAPTERRHHVSPSERVTVPASQTDVALRVLVIIVGVAVGLCAA